MEDFGVISDIGGIGSLDGISSINVVRWFDGVGGVDRQDWQCHLGQRGG